MELNYPVNAELTLPHMMWGGEARAEGGGASAGDSALLMLSRQRWRLAQVAERAKVIAPMRGLVLLGIHRVSGVAEPLTGVVHSGDREFGTSKLAEGVLRMRLDSDTLRFDHMRGAGKAEGLGSPFDTLDESHVWMWEAQRGGDKGA